ncbi:hypothetical protein [Streptomyces sp. YGL11-2]|uniref:baeRF2 domain-containing protein n=1 Tax=Streptomyces sp. YGL11-2 TaxID=3414028 RepID=UPI003CEA0F3C
MDLAFLNAVYAHGGPYVCAYLDTSRNTEEPDRETARRSRRVCEALVDQGADAATLAAVAGVVGCDREIVGRHGQAIVAVRGRVVLAEELPVPPARDEAVFTALPDLMPLVVQFAPGIRYVAATVHSLPLPYAEPADELEVACQAGVWPSSAVAPGDCHLMRGPAVSWLDGAGQEAADGIAALACSTDAEAIVLAGITWVRNVLADNLDGRWRKRTVTCDGDGYPAPRGRALMEEELAAAFAGRLRSADRARVDLFRARRTGRHGAVEGLSDVVAALQRSQAGTLLLNVPVGFPAELRVGVPLPRTGPPESDPGPYGALGFREGPAGAAVIRAAVRTGAGLIVVPQDQLPLTDGLGALLRYAGPERAPHSRGPAAS